MTRTPATDGLHRGLPAEHYVSPAFYGREVTHIFRRTWLCIGRLDQVDVPGDYRSVELLDEPLMMVRGEDGEVRVFSRICRHRASLVVAGAGNARAFVCPYHNWTYALDGRLLGAPMMGATPGFDPRSCHLRTVRSESWEGFLFVNFDADADPLAPTLAGLSTRLRGHGLAAMKTVRSYAFEYDCNWKVMADNFDECYHHIGAHRDSLEPTIPARSTVVEDTDGPYTIVRMPHGEGASATAVHPEETKSPVLPTIASLGPDDRRSGFLIHVFPALLMSVYPERMEFYETYPLGPRGRARSSTSAPRAPHSRGPTSRPPCSALRNATSTTGTRMWT